jgi:AraC-like DNA-binding protein
MARLTRAMTEDQAYRREGLTLAELAKTLEVGEAVLRRLINQELGYRNFNDFLHHYRLQEASQRLASEDLPILSIALECGYGSIGPFNRAFRQRFGMTPTEYRAAARMARHRQATRAEMD